MVHQAYAWRTLDFSDTRHPCSVSHEQGFFYEMPFQKECHLLVHKIIQKINFIHRVLNLFVIAHRLMVFIHSCGLPSFVYLARNPGCLGKGILFSHLH